MANAEHLNILSKGVKVWNRWRQDQPQLRPDLSESNLIGANLQSINLGSLMQTQTSNGDLSFWRAERNYLSEKEKLLRGLLPEHSDLPGANLYHADLTGADLRNGTLFQADLTWAHLTRTKLSMADLRRARLWFAEFIETDLRGADFEGATIGWTKFGSVDLSVALNIATVKHVGPSVIGIDTIYRSGTIPNRFLRDAGVPKDFLRFRKQFHKLPTSFYSCFISHSSKDKRFCDRLCSDLRAKQIRVWYFPEDAAWGEAVWGEIDRGIKLFDKLVVVCSKRSLQSGPVLREIERALQREDLEGGSVLFPVRIDDYLTDKWHHPRKADVLSKVAGDFRGWSRDPHKYRLAFERLTQALQAPNRRNQDGEDSTLAEVFGSSTATALLQREDCEQL